MKETKLSRLVARKLREVGVCYPKGTQYALLKHNPGCWQKSTGAWAWDLWVKLPSEGEFRPTGYGSPDQASKLRVASKLLLSSYGNVYFL